MKQRWKRRLYWQKLQLSSHNPLGKWQVWFRSKTLVYFLKDSKWLLDQYMTSIESKGCLLESSMENFSTRWKQSIFSNSESGFSGWLRKSITLVEEEWRKEDSDPRWALCQKRNRRLQEAMVSTSENANRLRIQST